MVLSQYLMILLITLITITLTNLIEVYITPYLIRIYKGNNQNR